MIENAHKAHRTFSQKPRTRAGQSRAFFAVIVGAAKSVGPLFFRLLLVITVSFIPYSRLLRGGPAVSATRVHQNILDVFCIVPGRDARAGAHVPFDSRQIVPEKDNQ